MDTTILVQDEPNLSAPNDKNFINSINNKNIRKPNAKRKSLNISSLDEGIKEGSDKSNDNNMLTTTSNNIFSGSGTNVSEFLSNSELQFTQKQYLETIIDLAKNGWHKSTKNENLKIWSCGQIISGLSEESVKVFFTAALEGAQNNNSEKLANLIMNERSNVSSQNDMNTKSISTSKKSTDKKDKLPEIMSCPLEFLNEKKQKIENYRAIFSENDQTILTNPPSSIYLTENKNFNNRNAAISATLNKAKNCQIDVKSQMISFTKKHNNTSNSKLSALQSESRNKMFEHITSGLIDNLSNYQMSKIQDDNEKFDDIRKNLGYLDRNKILSNFTSKQDYKSNLANRLKEHPKSSKDAILVEFLTSIEKCSDEEQYDIAMLEAAQARETLEMRKVESLESRISCDSVKKLLSGDHMSDDRRISKGASEDLLSRVVSPSLASPTEILLSDLESHGPFLKKIKVDHNIQSNLNSNHSLTNVDSSKWQEHLEHRAFINKVLKNEDDLNSDCPRINDHLIKSPITNESMSKNEKRASNFNSYKQMFNANERLLFDIHSGNSLPPTTIDSINPLNLNSNPLNRSNGYKDDGVLYLNKNRHLDMTIDSMTSLPNRIKSATTPVEKIINIKHSDNIYSPTNNRILNDRILEVQRSLLSPLDDKSSESPEAFTNDSNYKAMRILSENGAMINNKSNLHAKTTLHSVPRSGDCCLESPSVYVCPIAGCRKTFRRKAYVKKHMELHSSHKAYGCDLCSVRCRQYAGLYIHYKGVHKLKLKKCNVRYYHGNDEVFTPLDQVNNNVSYEEMACIQQPFPRN